VLAHDRFEKLAESLNRDCRFAGFTADSALDVLAFSLVIDKLPQMRIFDALATNGTVHLAPQVDTILACLPVAATPG
jgi:hypothetical protein